MPERSALISSHYDGDNTWWFIGRRRFASFACLAAAMARFGMAANTRARTPERAEKDREHLRIRPIGVIRTPFQQPTGTPIQPSRAAGARGTVHLENALLEGLRDLHGFDRIWLIYWLHKASGAKLVVTPFLDQQQRGIFATRSPARPVPIGISAVRLLAVHADYLEVADVDIIDGTPLLDIKPYVPEFDSYPASRAGWFDASQIRRRLADDRFESQVPVDKPDRH
jgi:tRNA-Thr(GGU) m(6)t(6)A37 methyltransferase TsaA